MKLDTVEEQQEKRLNRFLLIKDELLEMSQQLEHATAIYYIVKKVGEN